MTKLTDSDEPCMFSLNPETLGGDDDQVHVLPNPAMEETTVSFESPIQEQCDIIIVGTNGEVYITKSVPVIIGENNHLLDIHALSNGLYYVAVRGTRNYIPARFVKLGVK
jgi:type IX secretion system substrate protein